MPSSATASLRLEKMAAGENLNTWGDPHLNTDFDLIDKAIAGWTTIALTADHTLTTANYAADEARSALLKFTGTGNFAVTLPSVSKSYLIWNATTGDLTVTLGAGATITLDANAKSAVFTDGATGVYELGYANLGLKDYIDSAILSTTGSLPAVTGNAGKFIYCDGSTWLPKAPLTADLLDITTYTATRTAQAIAFAIAL